MSETVNQPAATNAADRYFDWHEKPAYYGDYLKMVGEADSLLDVGCGQAWMADHYRNYHGMDASQAAVERARARGRNVIRASADERFPFEDACFAVVFLKDILEHVDRPEETAREVMRVLKPGGRIFAFAPDAQKWVWDDYTHKRPFTRVSLRRVFEDHGARVERVGYEPIMPGVGAVCRALRLSRRPFPLWWMARFSIFRRNVYVVARKP